MRSTSCRSQPRAWRAMQSMIAVRSSKYAMRSRSAASSVSVLIRSPPDVLPGRSREVRCGEVRERACCWCWLLSLSSHQEKRLFRSVVDCERYRTSVGDRCRARREGDCASDPSAHELDDHLCRGRLGDDFGLDAVPSQEVVEDGAHGGRREW